MTIRGMDLFSGGGCGAFGAAKAGVEMVAAVDAWDVATQTYSDNFPTARANIVTAHLDDSSGPEMFPKRLGRVDLIIASPECTHHSIARGAMPRDEESRRSGLYVMRFIKKLKPRWLVLENVTLMEDGWAGFDNLIARLEREGYKVSVQRLDAADFGVPQSRRRLFILCDRERQPDLVVGRARRVRTAGEILDPKGRWPAGELYRRGRARATLDRAEAAIRELGEGKDFLVVYYGSDRAGGWQRLDRPLRTMTTLDRFGLVQWDDDGTPTLRMLQVPELKRAMGLEGFLTLRGTRRDQVKILGNGVCAPVMKAVIRSLTAEPKPEIRPWRMAAE